MTSAPSMETPLGVRVAPSTVTVNAVAAGSDDSSSAASKLTVSAAAFTRALENAGGVSFTTAWPAKLAAASPTRSWSLAPGVGIEYATVTLSPERTFVPSVSVTSLPSMPTFVGARVCAAPAPVTVTENLPASGTEPPSMASLKTSVSAVPFTDALSTTGGVAVVLLTALCDSNAATARRSPERSAFAPGV